MYCHFFRSTVYSKSTTTVTLILRRYTGTSMVWCAQHEHVTMERGSWWEKPVDLESPVPLIARGGFIIPTQTPANNTRFRSHPLRVSFFLHH